jgi:hypothetical protein
MVGESAGMSTSIGMGATVSYACSLGMILSENRLPFFGIMRAHFFF